MISDFSFLDVIFDKEDVKLEEDIKVEDKNLTSVSVICLIVMLLFTESLIFHFN